MSRYRSQIREVMNRNTFVTLALECGFNAYLPVYDGGIDLILYREADGMTLKVQLKGRWTIDRKYIGRGIHVAFPIGADWYLAPHDEMVKQGESAGYTASQSWIGPGLYSTGLPPQNIRGACAGWRLADIGKVATEAAQGDPAGDSEIINAQPN